MTEMPEETYAHLEGLDCLFMNALRVMPHPTHQSLAQALEQVERIRPREAYFIHASHRTHASASRPFGIRWIGDRGIN